MSAGEPLTENVRVRLSANEKAELEQQARKHERSVSSIARRAIRRELELMRKSTSRRGGGDAS